MTAVDPFNYLGTVSCPTGLAPASVPPGAMRLSLPGAADSARPEFAEWPSLLGSDGGAIPFLRYLPEYLSPLGARVRTALRERLTEAPSFVAFEGYDTVAVLAEVLRSRGADPAHVAGSWPRVAVGCGTSTPRMSGLRSRTT